MLSIAAYDGDRDEHDGHVLLAVNEDNRNERYQGKLIRLKRTIEVSEIEHKVDQARNFAELLDMLGDDVYDYEERGSKYSKADFGL